MNTPCLSIFYQFKYLCEVSSLSEMKENIFGLLKGMFEYRQYTIVNKMYCTFLTAQGSRVESLCVKFGARFMFLNKVLCQSLPVSLPVLVSSLQ